LISKKQNKRTQNEYKRTQNENNWKDYKIKIYKILYPVITADVTIREQSESKALEKAALDAKCGKTTERWRKARGFKYVATTKVKGQKVKKAIIIP